VHVPRTELSLIFELGHDGTQGASPGELHKLLQERLKAMSTLDTEVRLNNAVEYAEQSRASVAAKVALQSLQLG
jgi:hypothetical protein